MLYFVKYFTTILLHEREPTFVGTPINLYTGVNINAYDVEVGLNGKAMRELESRIAMPGTWMERIFAIMRKGDA